MKRYPSWAPSQLLAEIPRLERLAREEAERGDEARTGMLAFAGITAAENLHVAVKLVSHGDMEDVWGLLNRRAGVFKGGYGRRGVYWHLSDGRYHYSVELFDACCAGIAQRRLLPGLTRAETRDLHQKIAKTADDLLGLLATAAGSVHGHWGLYSEELAVLRNQLGISPADANVGNYLVGPGGLPLLDRFISRLKTNALKMAERPWAESQPNDPDAPIRFFALWLVQRFFAPRYGQPLNDIAARVTNVVMESDIDAAHVKGWVRTKDGREKRKGKRTSRPG